MGLLLAHATNNLLNDVVDWYKGVDKDNYFRTQYGPHPMKMMSRNKMAAFVLITGLTALSVAVILVILRGEQVFYLAVAGSFFLLFYTWPLKYYGLGEISVFIVWGLLMIGGAYFTITKEWSWEIVICTMPYSLGVTSVIFGKHIDKLNADKKLGIRTLPVLLGDQVSRQVAIIIILAQYVLVVSLVFLGYFSLIMLLPLLSATILKYVFQVYTSPKPKVCPPEFPRKDIWPLWFVAFAFVHMRRFGGLYVLGLVVDTLYSRYVYL